MSETRILVGELHRAPIRHPEVAALLDEWLLDNAKRFHDATGLDLSQIRLFYLLLLGASHLESVRSLEVEQAAIEAEVTTLLEGWLADRYR